MGKANQGGEFPTIPAAARRYGVSPGRLRAAVRAKELPAYRLGKRWLRLWEPELLAWLRSRPIRPPSEAAQAHARRRVAEILGDPK